MYFCRTIFSYEGGAHLDGGRMDGKVYLWIRNMQKKKIAPSYFHGTLFNNLNFEGLLPVYSFLDLFQQ